MIQAAAWYPLKNPGIVSIPVGLSGSLFGVDLFA